MNSFHVDVIEEMDREPGLPRSRVVLKNSSGESILLELTPDATVDLALALIASPIVQIGDENKDAVHINLDVKGWGRLDAASGSSVLQLMISDQKALRLKFRAGQLDRMLALLQTQDYRAGKGLSNKH